MDQTQITARHPTTGVWQKARWVKDHFGFHNDAIKFENGDILDPATIGIKIKKD